ncbi:MAG: DNA repair protein RecO [Patescibacteria group bacterium]
MAHQIYLTDGIVLKKKDFGEADRLFWIYTEKFGMVMASAKGVRLEKSKLRNNLSVFSYGEFAVISSRDFWRIIDAREISLPKLSSQVRLGGHTKVFVKISNLAVRMIKGEERNDKIWFELKNIFLTKENAKDLEVTSVAKLLKALGYMDKIPETKSELLSSINRAIKESML